MGLTGRVFVEQVAHDAALSNVVSIVASHPYIYVVVHHIQLQAALCHCHAVVDGNKVTL